MAKAKTKAKGKGKLPPALAKRAAAAAAMTPAQKAAWVAKMAAAKKAAAKKKARDGISRAASGQAQKSAKRYLATPAAKRRQARHDARAAELYAEAMANPPPKQKRLGQIDTSPAAERERQFKYGFAAWVRRVVRPRKKMERAGWDAAADHFELTGDRPNANGDATAAWSDHVNRRIRKNPPKSRAKHADPLPCALCSRPATSSARYLDTANNPPKAKADTFVVVVVGGGGGAYAARTKAEALEAAMPDHGDKLTIYHGVRARDAGAARLASSYQKARKVEHGRWSGA